MFTKLKLNFAFVKLNRKVALNNSLTCTIVRNNRSCKNFPSLWKSTVFIASSFFPQWSYIFIGCTLHRVEIVTRIELLVKIARVWKFSRGRECYSGSCRYTYLRVGLLDVWKYYVNDFDWDRYWIFLSWKSKI